MLILENVAYVWGDMSFVKLNRRISRFTHQSQEGWTFIGIPMQWDCHRNTAWWNRPEATLPGYSGSGERQISHSPQGAEAQPNKHL